VEKFTVHPETKKVIPFQTDPDSASEKRFIILTQ
jgi:hypothetical protein